MLKMTLLGVILAAKKQEIACLLAADPNWPKISKTKHGITSTTPLMNVNKVKSWIKDQYIPNLSTAELQAFQLEANMVNPKPSRVKRSLSDRQIIMAAGWQLMPATETHTAFWYNSELQIGSSTLPFKVEGGVPVGGIGMKRQKKEPKKIKLVEFPKIKFKLAKAEAEAEAEEDEDEEED